MSLNTEIRAFAHSVGADLLGIAPISRFDELPKAKHPASIFPEVKSVIVVGKRIVRGALRGVEEGTQFYLYDIYGRDWLENRVLAMITFRISEYLEDSGWEAVPLPNLPPEIPPLGIPVKEGLPAPNVMLDVDDIAVRAGVGEIGYSGVLLTPQFGPRQRIQVILTDCQCQEEPLLDEIIDTLSKEEHKALCPLGAISNEEKEIVICGKRMTVGNIDYGKCQICENGARPNPYHPAGKPDRLGAVCTRNLVHEFEKRGNLTNSFNNPFRKRPIWKIVSERKVTTEEEI